MTTSSNCPCDCFVHPKLITNPPGRDQIAYRVGDYTSFRHALLLSLPGETELVNWKPTGTSDLAVQMVEWWAYIADILTFYNERIANEDYLRTAILDGSVRHIIQLLGYRPRPGIGAAALLAALTSATRPFTLPQGFAVQSKPGPGAQPQIFELDADTVVQPLDEVSADPLPDSSTLGADGSVLLEGNVSSIDAGDRLLVVERNWSGSNTNYAFATVASLAQEADPRGSNNTRVRFTAALGLPDRAAASDYRLMSSLQFTRLWQYPGSPIEQNGSSTTIALQSVVRNIAPGDMILFDGKRNLNSAVSGETSVLEAFSAHPAVDLPQAPAPVQAFSALSVVERSFAAIDMISVATLASVTSYSELIWYANAPDPSFPQTPPTSPPGIAVLHSQLTVVPAYSNSELGSLVIRYGWQDVGQLIPTPSATFSASSPELIAIDPPAFPAGSSPVLVEDVNGDGESATGFVGADLTIMQLSDLPDDPPALTPPLNVLFNLLSMSRGKSVNGEVLGSGDASSAGQEFVLQKSPLTYLLSADSSSGGNYRSTLRVWVNGIEWQEVQSFYGQKPTAAIFVTHEDDDDQTHVQFGDGINGARLPSGTNNIVANYRFGSGAAAPDAGKLTTIVTAQPGLTAVRNPIAPTGGADPDPASQIRRYAPLSVMTFGRAVSGQDYEVIAASTPGVARAHAYWSFDFLQQRTTVTVYVGDDDGAVNAATIALQGDADPNRPVVVRLATAVPVHISFAIAIDPRYVAATVIAAVQQALLDPLNGLFGSERIGIGEVIYASEIYEACLSVPGTISVHDLRVRTTKVLPLGLSFFFPTSISMGSLASIVQLLFGTPYRFDPGEGAYFSLDSSALNITPEVNPNAG